jgi:hypothetical protein
LARSQFNDVLTNSVYGSVAVNAFTPANDKYLAIDMKDSDRSAGGLEGDRPECDFEWSLMGPLV